MNALPEMISAPEARERGLRPLTYPYRDEERGMLEAVLRDFSRASRPVALVAPSPDGSVEVWVEPIPAMRNGGAE